jgi:hypothetical protein
VKVGVQTHNAAYAYFPKENIVLPRPVTGSNVTNAYSALYAHRLKVCLSYLVNKM